MALRYQMLHNWWLTCLRMINSYSVVPCRTMGTNSSSPLLLHRLFLFPTLILWDFASVLESPDIPASGAVILSKGPQGHHIVIVGEDAWDAVRGTLLVFPETSSPEAAQRGSTKIPNSQKETVSTYLITCLGMPDRGQQSFCRVLLGLLRRRVLMPLLLCLILFWLWAISPALSGLFIRARQCCCETVGARVEKKQGGNNVRSLHFSPFPSLGKSRWISLGSQLKLTSGLLMAKTQP